MTKLASLLLSALLLCGLVAIQAKNNVSVAEPQRLPVSVTLVQEGSARMEWAAKPLFLKDQKNTEWSNDAGVRLVIYEDSAAYLFTANEIFTLKTDDDGFVLQLEMYRTPFDAEPATILPAGTVKITVDGDTVKLAVAEDPLGALAFDGLNGAVLTKEKHTPYPYPDFNFFSGPLEPGTEWFCYFNMGEHRHAKLSITVGEDGAMSGVLTMPDGTARSCVLFGNGNTFALTADTEKEAELIFLGERKKTDETHYDRTRYELLWLDLSSVFDPLELTGIDEFALGRQRYGEWDLAYIPGKSLDSVILALIRDGWTETKDMEAQYPALEGWFTRLVKDGQTLMIHYEYDFSSPYEYYVYYPDAYVLYGADGAALQWGGSKPIDHRIADSYRIGKDTYFDPGTGVQGMIVGEDSDAYFLDDGSIAVETTAHEGSGDMDFEIIRVIP
jgi:hypothetical protein